MSVDPRRLPRVAEGTRSTTWWGMVLFVAIEATVMASLVSSYFYLRLGAPHWPPEGIAPPGLLLPAAQPLLLLLSAGAVAWADRRSRAGQGRRFQLGLWAGILGVLAYLALGVHEMATRRYSWAEHAYGSIVWTLSGYAAFHAVTLLLFGLTLAVFGLRGHLGPERRVAVQIASLYWTFVAASGLLTYLTLNLAPHLMG